MKSKTLKRIFSMSLFVAALTSAGMVAQQPPPQYTVTELATLGGTGSSPSSINDDGLISGGATLASDRVEHAVSWMNGVVTDLGTLPGGVNSAVGFPVKNNSGVLVGFSQTGDTNPLHEDWRYVCGPFETRPICQARNLISLGFVWKNGSMISLLPFFGGYISESFGANNLGQVVGFAETGYADASCLHPQVQDYMGVVWNIDGSIMQALAPYHSDKASVAAAINDKGQIVGASGPCAPISPALAAHALLWQYGSATVTDLGNLGGSTNNVAFAINRQGQIVGFSGLPGNATAHAFLYQKGGPMQDLGTLFGDVFSIAYSINDSDQIVGQSCDANSNCRAVLWQNGAKLDLNSLVPAGTPTLVVAFDINKQGQIVGEAYNPTTGEAPGFVLTPQ
jgi:probable HAF family extracellular repeat protein